MVNGVDGSMWETSRIINDGPNVLAIIGIRSIICALKPRCPRSFVCRVYIIVRRKRTVRLAEITHEVAIAWSSVRGGEVTKR